MQCKKFVIETDGTTNGTNVILDDKTILPSIQRIEFSADAKDIFVKILLEKAMIDADGKLKTRNTQVRDFTTEKFKEAKKVITEPISIEFIK